MPKGEGAKKGPRLFAQRIGIWWLTDQDLGMIQDLFLSARVGSAALGPALGATILLRERMSDALASRHGIMQWKGESWSARDWS